MTRVQALHPDTDESADEELEATEEEGEGEGEEGMYDDAEENMDAD